MPKNPQAAIAAAIPACVMILENRNSFPASVVAQSIRILRQHAPELVKLEGV